MTAPDYVYNPDDWEYTQPWGDRSDMVDDLPVGEIQRFSTLTKGPDKWAAKVPTSRDDAGDPIDWETRWFDSEAEARTACGLPPFITAG